jgi:hypothetical protein
MAEKNQYLKMRCWINPRSSKCQHKKILRSVAKEEIDSVVKESLMEKSMRKKI